MLLLLLSYSNAVLVFVTVVVDVVAVVAAAVVADLVRQCTCLKLKSCRFLVPSCNHL